MRITQPSSLLPFTDLSREQLEALLDAYREEFVRNYHDRFSPEKEEADRAIRAFESVTLNLVTAGGQFV